MTTATSPTTPPAVYRNDAQPDWGLGLVVEEKPDRWTLIFEHGGRRSFMKAMAKSLVPVTLDEAALAALQSKLRGRHAPRAHGAAAKKSAPKKAQALFLSFGEQLAFFEKMFVGGFEDPRFIDEERGREGVAGKAGYKAAAIAMTQAELAKGCFATGAPEALFGTAKRILGATNIVYPIEGPIPFGAIAEADRPAVIAGLEHLLHGEGEYGERLEKFASSVNLKDKSGTARRVSWPLATVFGALYAPNEHVCVKPKSFAHQGATLGLPAELSASVTALAYRQFLDVAKETQRRLLEAGHRPKDLVDVYSFIWRTNKEKDRQG